MSFKPMLAAPVELSKLVYPVLASPKLDGVRAIVKNGFVLSRSLKPIPNDHIQRTFGTKRFEGFDGELILGDPRSPTVYRDTVSAVMSRDGEPGVTFFVFDCVNKPDARYEERRPQLQNGTNLFVMGLEHRLIHSEDELLEWEDHILSLGYEGLILRSPNSPYKFGRSTVKEGYLLKLKRFVDAEFEIIGFEERQHNGNEATTNELGRTKRSSHKENKTGRGDLGALVLKHETGSFNCGTGFDDALRASIWANRSTHLGALVKVKYFAVGMKDLPRHPVFLGFRSEMDT